ncbi:hypothetical protein [Caenispirillum bisanense]|uniref:hypothetical protein n=1 Tax=Caenispirillum bisanense TaxID=414052 RepID=UPI0031D24FC8
MTTVANAPLVIDNIRPGGAGTGAPANQAAKGDDEVSFWDFVDIINPLQHLPIISTIYREITGDTIKPLARVAGGALFGGAIGAAVAVVTEVVEEAAGLNNGETLLSLFKGDDAAPAEGETQLAAAEAGKAGEGAGSAALPASAAALASAIAAAPAQQAPAAAAAATAAPAAATTTVAGDDARFFPMAQTAGVGASAANANFMPIRGSDFRNSDGLARMPAPEKRPAGLAPRAHDHAMVGMAPAPRPASAALVAQQADDGAQYLTVPTKAQMAAAETGAAVSQATADDAVLRSLQAQGLQAEAAKHPMLQAALRPTAAAAAAAASPAVPAAAAVTGVRGFSTAADSLAAAEAAGGAEGGVQEVPGWFDGAMMKALDRYQQTGRLTTGAAAGA